jgi:hypothetical protein
MNSDQRIAAANHPIEWRGDLNDDCTAEWAGLMLRAEEMEENSWWWAVYDMQRGEMTIDSSNLYDENIIDGQAARARAEKMAKDYINTISKGSIARFIIADTFRITGRGLVLLGNIEEGLISSGNTIELLVNYMIRHRKITAVELSRNRHNHQLNTGLLIKCIDEHEIMELREWRPDNEPALIFA